MALIFRVWFSFYIPLAGASGIRVSLHGIFSAMPAILFGPVYGAIVSGLTDFLGFQLRPTGPWLYQLTLSAIAEGFLRGLLWMLLWGKVRKMEKGSLIMRLGVVSASLIMLGIGIFNMVGAGSFYTYDPFTLDLISAGGLFTLGLIIIGGLGLLLLAMEGLFSKYLLKGEQREKGLILPLLLTMMIAGLIRSTVNTEILRQTIFDAWQLVPFTAVWIPRIIEEIITTTLGVYIMAFLLGVMERQAVC